jgi:hypothetical protein
VCPTGQAGGGANGGGELREGSGARGERTRWARTLAPNTFSHRSPRAVRTWRQKTSPPSNPHRQSKPNSSIPGISKDTSAMSKNRCWGTAGSRRRRATQPGPQTSFDRFEPRSRPCPERHKLTPGQPRKTAARRVLMNTESIMGTGCRFRQQNSRWRRKSPRPQSASPPAVNGTPGHKWPVSTLRGKAHKWA